MIPSINACHNEVIDKVRHSYKILEMRSHASDTEDMLVAPDVIIKVVAVPSEQNK